MTHLEQPTQTDFDAVVEALRAHDRFLVVTHENPDGDALGSMLGATLGLRALGKDVVMYLAGLGAASRPSTGSCRSPRCCARLPADVGGARAARARLRERAADRAGAGRRSSSAALVVDVDHHHDNTRFGAVNLVVADASSTAEIVRDLLARARRRADAGDRRGAVHRARHRHRAASSTRTRRRRRSGSRADLVEAGADVHGVFKRVYETVQFAKLKLLARALEHAQVYEGGRLVVSYLFALGLRGGRRGRSRTRRGSSTSSARARARSSWR